MLLALVLLIAAVASLWSVLKERTRRSSEVELRERLFMIRHSIDEFGSDQDQCPRSFDDLVIHGYFRHLPLDPITQSATTWQPVYDDFAGGFGNAVKMMPPCLVDVHSGSKETGSDGTRYSEW